MRATSILSSTLLLLAALFVTAVLPAFTTPQLCYTDINKVAPDYIVPCWTTHKTPHYSCCKVNNKCLSHSACYDADTGVTYQYGCTDPSFEDEHCPQKCGLNRDITNWVGLVYCGGGGGLPDKSWICHHPDNCYNCSSDKSLDPRIQKFPPTTCKDLKHDGQYVAFKETNTLSDIVPIPAATNILQWFSDNADRWQSTASASSIATPTSPGPVLTTLSSTTLSGGPASGTASLTPNPPSSNTNSKKVGIAVGVSCGGVAALVLIGFALWHYCLRPSAAYNFPSKKRTPPLAPLGQGAKTGDAHTDGPASPPPAEFIPEYKAELAADAQVDSPHHQQTFISEMEGSPVDPSSLHTPDVSPLPSQSSWGPGRFSGMATRPNAGNPAELSGGWPPGHVGNSQLYSEIEAAVMGAGTASMPHVVNARYSFDTNPDR